MTGVQDLSDRARFDRMLDEFNAAIRKSELSLNHVIGAMAALIATLTADNLPPSEYADTLAKVTRFLTEQLAEEARHAQGPTH
jgi:hypothetical protein